jgi:transposase
LVALLIRIELVVLVLVGFVIPTLINLVRGPARQAYPDDPVKYVWGGEAVTLHAIWFSGTLDDARLWPNTTHDGQVVEAIHADLAQKHLLPSEHLVDTGYTDSDLPVSSRSQYGVELVGPVMGDTSWQARETTGFDLSAFTVDWAARAVTCPGGHTSVKWCPTHDRHGNDVIHVEFAPADCRGCPSRPRCTRSAKEPREMGLRPRAQQEALWAARRRQTTTSFKEKYARRAGVEGTLSQAIHVCGLRRAKYIGLAKTRLQHLITAAALNVVRAGAWLAGFPRAQTRHAPFAVLALATCSA